MNNTALIEDVTLPEYFDSRYLRKCQVDTPLDVVKYAWTIAHQHKPFFSKVLDLGAGDGKFAQQGNYGSYLGMEIDKRRSNSSTLPKNAEILHACAFSEIESQFDLCIGNPPYVRHHDLNEEWQNKIATTLSSELGFRLDRRSNAFSYFLAQSILRTKPDGLVLQVIPYEWVTRPSYKFIRDYIEANKWNVKVYRFEQDIFAHSKVLTTASITVIDKSCKDNEWSFYKISKDFNIERVKSPTGSDEEVIEYKNHSRKFNFAKRGLSPGGQKIFCLTEEDRSSFNLKVGLDVVPCITNLKAMPSHIKELNYRSFKKNLMDAGEKCWLILSTQTPSDSLAKYLEQVDPKERDNYTCRNQNPWWCYTPHPAPDILYGSGFSKFGPKVVINNIKAVAVGTVHGIHKVNGINLRELREQISQINFENQLVSHSGVLKKIEVNQMNTILEKLCYGS